MAYNLGLNKMSLEAECSVSILDRATIESVSCLMVRPNTLMFLGGVGCSIINVTLLSAL